MELKLYDTLTKEKRVFTPLDPANVRMYVCGPTVYDFAHIGNARPVIVFDVLFRLLQHLAKQGVWDGGKGETKVTYVRNITDVDDKINDRAARDFPGMALNDAIRKVTEKTANQFHADVAALGCLAPTHEPRATEHIGEMIDIIGMLLENGHAYIAQGKEGREILFEVAKMKRYGELSKRKLDEQIEGARVAVEDHKKNPADFVLWKESSPAEPGWPAKFKAEYPTNSGEIEIYGRPGWHIECSAMAWKYLGKTFDIHGGGIDLVFPHHENELAQSCCAFHENRMAQTWMHNGFLQVEGEKMSKSTGNFVTINEALEDLTLLDEVPELILYLGREDRASQNKNYGKHLVGSAMRLNMLTTHYRQPINWTRERLVESVRTLVKWYLAMNSGGAQLSANGVAHYRSMKHAVPDYKFVSSLLDDLNCSTAFSRLHSPEVSAWQLFGSLDLLGLIDEKIVELFETPVARRLDSSQQSKVDKLLANRLAARARKDFAESDRIRDELAEMGITLKDFKDPVSGEMKTEIAR